MYIKEKKSNHNLIHLQKGVMNDSSLRVRRRRGEAISAPIKMISIKRLEIASLRSQ